MVEKGVRERGGCEPVEGREGGCCEPVEGREGLYVVDPLKWASVLSLYCGAQFSGFKSFCALRLVNTITDASTKLKMNVVVMLKYYAFFVIYINILTYDVTERCRTLNHGTFDIYRMVFIF